MFEIKNLVKDEQSGLSIDVGIQGGIAGLWVSGGGATHSLGLVFDKKLGPYVIFWSGEHVPNYVAPAISHDGLQIPMPDGHVRHITWQELADAIPLKPA